MMNDTDRSRDGDCSPECSSFLKERSGSPQPSCVSMKSDQSMGHPIAFQNKAVTPNNSYFQKERLNSPQPSCVSMKSDQSMGHPIAFQNEAVTSNNSYFQKERLNSPQPSCVSMKSDQSMGHPIVFQNEAVTPNNGKRFQKRNYITTEHSCVSVRSEQSMGHPVAFKSKGDSPNIRSIQKEISDTSHISCVSMRSEQSMGHPVAFRNEVTHDIGVQQERSVNEHLTIKGQRIQVKENRIECQLEALNKFKTSMETKFQCLYEGAALQGNPTLLNEIYTELYITEGDSGEIITEHEVRQIETQYRRAATEDTPIQCNNIFKPLPGQDKPIRTVLTKGVAGIGKTVSVQKFILDWAEGKENQNIHLIFPLPFRELNLIRDRTLSLLDLLHIFYTETKELDISSSEYKVSFIFDGLDECRLPLDFQRNVKVCDVTQSASLDELLTNLIIGNLLPSALIWITSRPAAADLIPSEFVHRVTELRGFNDPQKEEYFRKRITNLSLANRIISHLKSSRSLYIMCHIPVFCWISATVLEKMLSEAESGEIPKTLTQMYTHFLIIQTNIKHEKDYETMVKDEDMIIKLGKLAFQQLMEGNLIFYEEDLRECGIDVTEASVYSGLCTQIFREEFLFYEVKMFCFVHLSIQEHLAALYVHLSFVNKNGNMFDHNITATHENKTKEISLSDLHQRAVDEALASKNGHLDLFLRFLLGLSMESNQSLLQGILTQTGSSSHTNEGTIVFIQMRIWSDPSPEKSINLFHCLNELGDQSLVEEIQQYTKSGKIKQTELSPSQWCALVYVLLTSELETDVFQLRRFIGERITADEALLKLLPVIEASRSAQISDCNLSEKSISALTSTLSSQRSCLRELHLSVKTLRDSGVKLLSSGLENPHCKLEILRLSSCGVTDEGFAALSSVLRSNPSHLRELDLSQNKIRDSGVKLLSEELKNTECKLKKLRLSTCDVTDEGCAALCSALRSNPSHLRELDLSVNQLRDSGVKLLSEELKNPECKLEILRLSSCGVRDEGCAALCSALRSNPSLLRELDLSGNQLRDSGVKLLFDGLKNPDCKLEKLRLSTCDVTDEGSAALCSALRSNPSHLRELDLSGNRLRDSGVKLLSEELKNPECKLEILRLISCGVRDEGFAALSSALRSNPSLLRELDLSQNKIRDSAVKKQLIDLQDPSHNGLKVKFDSSMRSILPGYSPHTC